MPQHSKDIAPLAWLLLVTTVLYLFYYWFNVPMAYELCELCDMHQYKKLFDYFETGEMEQMRFPYYTRPLVPLLASLLPGNDIIISFHVINFIFTLLSVVSIFYLWKHFKMPVYVMTIGYGWLLLHWTGIIRYNLMDYVTVDVPVYLVQSLALILFFKKQYKWFYILTPLALLQKESFMAVSIVLIGIHIYQYRKENWFSSSKHLIFSLVLGMAFQKLVLWLMPEQMDQRRSINAILYHIRLVVYDPTRLIRWFTAFGNAYGLFPVLIFIRFKWGKFKSSIPMTLAILSLMYMAFGLSTGGDMTRIMYLGFPFIMTLSLLTLKGERLPVLVATILLSLPVLRFYPMAIDTAWAVDYASNTYVYQWATYYFVAILILWFTLMKSDKNAWLHKQADNI